MKAEELKAKYMDSKMVWKKNQYMKNYLMDFIDCDAVFFVILCFMLHRNQRPSSQNRDIYF